MSGPHLMKFRVIQSPHWQRTIHGGHAVMKCRSEGDGWLALRRKACKKHETYVEVEFVERKPESQEYEYEFRGTGTGQWARGGTTLPMPSRNVAKRMLKSLSKTMQVPLRLKPGENSMNASKCAPPYGLAPRFSTVTSIPGLPETSRFGDVNVGDEVVVKLKVTHTGIPGVVAGVKLDNIVVGFEDKDILDVVRAPKPPKPPAVGDKVLWHGHYHAHLLAIDGEDAFIRTLTTNSVATSCLYRDLAAA